MADRRPLLIRRVDGFPRIMGVLNITPDSFHPDSRVNGLDDALNLAGLMIEDGADWLDIGGESTRPGATAVDEVEEMARVVPIISAIRERFPEVGISVDTRRANVARQALLSGADMINDVSSLADPRMLEVVVEFGCPICIMHMQGLPDSMQIEPTYCDVVDEVRTSLAAVARKLSEEGVSPNLIIVDPGIGFGKLLEHNLSLLSAGRNIVPNQEMLLLWGVSRKRMFEDLLGRNDSENRLAGTLGVAAMAKSLGVDIIRVHDVREHADLFATMAAME
ncbi:MAG: dihydropteroate synthase [Euryarchaeota archaeon]|nr:dihydropteroate synthase [Euryarchaeota archaeon]MBT3653909.1 dihydropteroate synthase [Euryarchaeota archaeon]MBT3757313.1 dihydropteroate synthase [Euryarchaeota archaeon]MBT4050142.1 dihydropteroate synthase [Euryarchaeota archaeon]MBT4650326.1 dihydropteroate synthase [Euryarchaeota archaeon]